MAKKKIKSGFASVNSSKTSTSNLGSGSTMARRARKRSSKSTLTTSTLPAAAVAIQHGFPIVGIGASADGLEALDEFFKILSADMGLAFVVVTEELETAVE